MTQPMKTRSNYFRAVVLLIILTVIYAINANYRVKGLLPNTFPE